MAEDLTLKQRYYIYFGINIVYFLMYLTPAAFIISKFHLDKAAIINVAFSMTSIFLKLINWILILTDKNDYSGYFSFIDILASSIVTISLYYFIFEMLFVYQTL